jgi:hypothetical protein
MFPLESLAVPLRLPQVSSTLESAAFSFKFHPPKQEDAEEITASQVDSERHPSQVVEHGSESILQVSVVHQ